MKTKQNLSPEPFPIEEICFGLDRPTDERSLLLFLQKCADPSLLNTLVPRLSDREIDETVLFFSGLLKRHLSKEEYHTFFLGA